MQNLKRLLIKRLKKQKHNRKLHYAVGAGLLFFVLCFPDLVFAQTNIGLEVGLGDTKQSTGLTNYIAVLYEFIVGLIAILAASSIMLNGVRWTAAGGNSEQIGKAKDGMKSAIAALVIAVTSYVLLYTLNPNLTVLNNIIPPSPNTPSEPVEMSEIPNTPAGGQCGATAADVDCTGVVTVDLEYTVQNSSKSSMQLVPAAAEDWNRMAADFYARYDKKIPVNHMFRSFEYQECLYTNQIGENPSDPNCNSKGHISGASVDMNTGSFTVAEYNWLACGNEAGCTITGKTKSGYNTTAGNSYNWKVLNYNADKAGGKIPEDHHFDYQGASSVCQACPDLVACGC